MKKHNPVNSFLGRKYFTKESCIKAIQELKQMLDTQKSLAALSTSRINN